MPSTGAALALTQALVEAPWAPQNCWDQGRKVDPRADHGSPPGARAAVGLERSERRMCAIVMPSVGRVNCQGLVGQE